MSPRDASGSNTFCCCCRARATNSSWETTWRKTNLASRPTAQTRINPSATSRRDFMSLRQAVSKAASGRSDGSRAPPTEVRPSTARAIHCFNMGVPLAIGRDDCAVRGRRRGNTLDDERVVFGGLDQAELDFRTMLEQLRTKQLFHLEVVLAVESFFAGQVVAQVFDPVARGDGRHFRQERDHQHHEHHGGPREHPDELALLLDVHLANDGVVPDVLFDGVFEVDAHATLS